LILLLVCHHVMAGTKSSWKQVDVFPIFSFITQYISYINPKKRSYRLDLGVVPTSMHIREWCLKH
jgi:hypothetical protein